MDAQAVTHSDSFRKISRSRKIVSLGLSLVMFTSYFAYILILAKRKEWLAREMHNGLPIGIPVGVGLILLAWALTGIYVLWANSSHDRKVHALKSALER